jgi:hypothetical protein
MYTLRLLRRVVSGVLSEGDITTVFWWLGRWRVAANAPAYAGERFKGIGMRWSENGFNHLLHLRLALDDFPN